MRLLGLYNFEIFIVLMMIGFYTLISRGNLVKKLLGLNIFQTSVFIFYISLGKVRGGTAPILVLEKGSHGESEHGEAEGDAAAQAVGEAADHAADAGSHALEVVEGVVYANPLPHVLILTAIVVGIATTAVGLALVVRIKEAYGTIEEEEILLEERSVPN